jgi:PAS domain S-box-containing protein
MQRANPYALQSAILESVAEGILVVGNNWEIISYNQKFLTMWGLPEAILESGSDSQALAFVLDQLKHPESFLEKVKDIYARPEVEYYDVLEFKDGRIFERYSQPFKQGGSCIGRVVSFRDITDERRAEEALRGTLSLHRATLESTADGILVVDREGKFVSFNQKFVEMWRVPQGIVDSRDDNRALAFVLDQLADPEGFLAKVKELYAQPDAESHDMILFKDGRIFERFSRPQRIGGLSVGRVWSFRDVTERRRAEEALRRAHDELEERVRERTSKLLEANLRLKEQIVERQRAEERLCQTLERLRALSHSVLQMQENDYEMISRELHDNIAQSLYALRMRLERVERVASDPSEYRGEIREAAARLMEVVYDVRNMSRQWRSDLLGEFGLVAALESHVKDFQKRTGIETNFECASDPSLKTASHVEIHLYRIAQEALSNVAKHARATQVTLRLKDLGKLRKLSVTDNGVGFLYGPSEERERPSKGIGLICMQERADLLKGTLEITTRPGSGTTIAVKVPLSS